MVTVREPGKQYVNKAMHRTSVSYWNAEGYLEVGEEDWVADVSYCMNCIHVRNLQGVK